MVLSENGATMGYTHLQLFYKEDADSAVGLGMSGIFATKPIHYHVIWGLGTTHLGCAFRMPKRSEKIRAPGLHLLVIREPQKPSGAGELSKITVDGVFSHLKRWLDGQFMMINYPLVICSSLLAH